MLSVSSEVRGRLQLFRRQYLQLLELRHLKYPAEEHLRRAEVQAWLYSKLFHVEENPRLPPERYRMQVLKTLLAKVEGSIKDPEEDVRLTTISLHCSKTPKYPLYLFIDLFL